MSEPTIELFADRIACFAWRDGIRCTEVRDYAADQIRAAIEAERERCAKLCEDMALVKEIVCPEECAAVIRRGPSGE